MLSANGKIQNGVFQVEDVLSCTGKHEWRGSVLIPLENVFATLIGG